MEFEQLQKIWDQQNNKPMYVINDEAMSQLIQKKKMQAAHITNITEVMLIGVNMAVAVFVFAMEIFSSKSNVSIYILSGWMLVTALYVLVNRIKRINGSNQFDRSVKGDLDHAISVASYQVNLSHVMRWNILPIGGIVIFGLWEGNKSVWFAIGLLAVLIIAHYFSGWEHGIYVKKRDALEVLKRKVEEGVF